LSIEKALSLPSATSVNKYRTVILYGLEFTQTMPFYAFISTEVPRTLTVTEESLTNPSANVRTGVVFKVKIDNTETAWLPDLTYLENLLK
jgi:chemosensory pili system protein ChpC